MRDSLPERIEPQLASPVGAPPSGDGWLHEIKYDGYRTMARVSGRDVRLITRGGHDWTRRYGDLPAALGGLPCRDAIVDGEIVVLDEKGVSRFGLLQAALSRGASTELVFFAFDLLHLNGWNLVQAPLDRRKALLAQLVGGATVGSAAQYSDHVVGSGQDLFHRVSALGLEGIISKRIVAPYQSGRSKTWTKTKAQVVGDFVIAGYTTSAAAGGLAALALAEWVDGELVYRGRVGTGFDARTLVSLLARLEGLREGASPVEGSPAGDVHWVRPVLSARIHYTNLTEDGSLRHPVFKGLREVKLHTQVPPGRTHLISDADLASITITNPRRRLFGRSGATKLDVAVYYAAVGDFMLPHLLGRPVSLVRCPTGKPEDCFFQRHAFTGMPSSVATFTRGNPEDEAKTYISIEDARAYLALAQFGVVEFHTWGARRKKLETPDRIVFDLDPGEGIAWRTVVEAAVHLRGALEARGLMPFVKTTGGDGLHLIVPIRPKHDWKQVHAATGAIAADIARTEPDTFTTTMGAANRVRRIFIDFHRNASAATAVAPYSLRARVHLPASTPVNWTDLASIDAPADLNYSSLPSLIGASGDPWAQIEAAARDLPI